MALLSPQAHLRMSKRLRQKALNLSGPKKKKAIALANTGLALAKLSLMSGPRERHAGTPICGPSLSRRRS
jgi:hypothetical protein